MYNKTNTYDADINISILHVKLSEICRSELSEVHSATIGISLKICASNNLNALYATIH